MVQLIQDGLERNVSPAAMHRAARLFQASENMFWDCMTAIATL